MEGKNGIVDLSNKNIKSLNDVFIKNKEQVQHLTLSYNSLKSLYDVHDFNNLKTLIIDNNLYTSLKSFPNFPKLDTLSAIANQFDNLTEFLVQSKRKFPKLSNLSLQKNPMVPNLSDVKEYFQYRETVLRERPDIKILDSMPLEPMDMTILDSISVENPEEPVRKERLRVLLPEANGFIEAYSSSSKKKISAKSEGNRFVMNKDL